MRGGVVDEQPVLEVLAGVGEVQAEQLGRAAGAGVLARSASCRTRSPPKVTTTCLNVASRPTCACWWPSVDGVVGPVLRRVTTVSWAPSPTTISTLSAQRRGAGVVEHDGRLGERPDVDDEWPATAALGAVAGAASTTTGSVELGLGRRPSTT